MQNVPISRSCVSGIGSDDQGIKRGCLARLQLVQEEPDEVAILMNTVDAVVTRVLDVRPYRHFWIVEVEVLSWGRYSSTTIIRDTEKTPEG